MISSMNDTFISDEKSLGVDQKVIKEAPNIFKTGISKLQSQNLFTKISIVIIAIVALVTPFIIKYPQVLGTHAADSTFSTCVKIPFPCFKGGCKELLNAKGVNWCVPSGCTAKAICSTPTSCTHMKDVDGKGVCQTICHKQIVCPSGTPVPCLPRPTCMPGKDCSNPILKGGVSYCQPSPMPKSVSMYGVYEFNGSHPGNVIELQDPKLSPYIAGGQLAFYWADIEPQEGQYNWSLIHQYEKLWTDKGKKVTLRITMSGNCMGGVSCHRTPAWVFTDGAKYVTQQTGQGTATYPVFWDPIYQAKIKAFIQAYAAEFDNDPNISYINAAVGNDGETIISKDKNGQALPIWSTVGYSDQLWLLTIQHVVYDYAQSFHTQPLAVQVDSTFIGKTMGRDAVLQVINTIHQHYPHLFVQDDALQANQNLPTLNPLYTGLLLVSEQKQPTTQPGELAQELQTAANVNKAKFILVFPSDLEKCLTDTADMAALQEVANKFSISQTFSSH